VALEDTAHRPGTPPLLEAYEAQNEQAAAEDNALKRTLSNPDSQPVELDQLRQWPTRL